MKQFKILIACESSGKVLDQMLALGLDAYSCDLLPTDSIRKDRHFQCDVRDILKQHWDAIISFPTCTHLCVSGARHFEAKRKDGRQQEGIDFFMLFANHPAKYKAIENPIGIMSTIYRKPDQIIQPWQFGHGETKATCFWLTNLPKLIPTDVVEGREARVHKMAPGPNRQKKRSETYSGIAEAIGHQWGQLVFKQLGMK